MFFFFANQPTVHSRGVSRGLLKSSQWFQSIMYNIITFKLQTLRFCTFTRLKEGENHNLITFKQNWNQKNHLCGIPLNLSRCADSSTNTIYLFWFFCLLSLVVVVVAIILILSLIQAGNLLGYRYIVYLMSSLISIAVRSVTGRAREYPNPNIQSSLCLQRLNEQPKIACKIR